MSHRPLPDRRIAMPRFPASQEATAAYIRSHGCPCRVTPTGFRVAHQFSSTKIGQRARWQVKVLPFNMTAVRAFLGY